MLEEWQTSTTEPTTDQSESLRDVEELISLLTNHEVESLLLAHDLISNSIDGLKIKNSGQHGDQPSTNSTARNSMLSDNIKIIRIDKTHEPLGATVRNEGDAVIIGTKGN